MSIRPGRVFAIAARDLRHELKGRRGLLFPAVLAGLLLPTATIKPPTEIPTLAAPAALWLTGEVPPHVRSVYPEHGSKDGPRLDFHRHKDGALVVRGGSIPEAMRELLDKEGPSVRVERRARPIRLPGRSLLFALISASTLTGAIASSIGGERTAGTLTTLLTAAVSKTEIVLGKCLAWGGLGALASALAATVAIVIGNVEFGWWFLPLLSVAPCTIAIGFWLMRRATDVIGGATVVIRLLPAALGMFGMIAWGIGHWYPLLGSAVPLGGALVAAGATWPGAMPCLIATASTGACTALLILRTSQTLEDKPSEMVRDKSLFDWLLTTGLAVAAIAGPLLGPLLWSKAGNSAATESLPPTRGVLAGAVGLLMILLIRSSRNRTDRLTERTLHPGTWLLAAAVGLGLGFGDALLGVPIMSGAALESIHGRMQLLHHPVGPWWMVLGVVGAQELFFRHTLRRDFGGSLSIAAHVLVLTPLQPIRGVVTAWVLVTLAKRSNSVVPGILARILAIAIATHGPNLGVGSASLIIATTVALVAWADRQTREEAHSRRM